MADQYRKGYEDDYRPHAGRGWTERTGDEMRTTLGDDEARWRRQQDERMHRQPPGGDRGWRDQGDGSFDRGRSGTEAWRGSDRDRGPYGQPERGQYGQYGEHGPQSGQYGGGPYGRGYPESDFVPHRVGSSPRESEQRYGSGGDWRTSGSSGQDQGRPGGAWGSAGSYGRSQGAGSFGGRNWEGHYGSGGYSGAAGPDWDTGGGYGGETSFVSPRSGYGPSASGSPVPRESYWGRGPKGYTRSDERIREDVSDRLERDHGVDASDITVNVQQGEVILTGTVTSRDQKRRAEDCVESVSGVKDVTNNLRVNRAQSSQTLPSSETSTSILGLGGQKPQSADATSESRQEGRPNGSSGKPGLSA